MNLTQEEFDLWKEMPITEAMMAFIAARRRMKHEEWEDGSFSGPAFEETVIRNTTALGYCSGLKEIAELTFDQLVTELSDE